MARIIDGTKISKEIRAGIAVGVQELRGHEVTPTLAVVLVGEDPASQVYVRHKVQATVEAGLESFRISLTGFILPFMIVYNHALLGLGAWQEIVMACALGVAAVWMMSIALVGWYQKHVNVAWRVLLAAAAVGWSRRGRHKRIGLRTYP